MVSADNLGGDGRVEFALQRLTEGGFWATDANQTVDAVAGQPIAAGLSITAAGDPGDSFAYRVVVLVDGVEMDRQTVPSLLVKEVTVRDGEALSQQLSEDLFSVTLFLIALGSVSFGMYALVMRRRLLAPPSEEALVDQTADVMTQMEAEKAVPAIAPAAPEPVAAGTPPPPPMNAQPPAPAADRSQPPPLPPTGLPDGWTEEQWASYGWQYIDALATQ